MTEGNFVYSVKTYRRQDKTKQNIKKTQPKPKQTNKQKKQRKNKVISCVEGTRKEETRFCTWKQFVNTENAFCTFCYFVVLSIGVGKQLLMKVIVKWKNA